MRTIWILGDQLHEAHPALARADKTSDVVLFIESRRRSHHLRYHQHKLVLLFSAMRHRAETLRAAGWTVDYHELVDDFTTALLAHKEKFQPERLLLQEPNDYATTHALPALAKKIGVPIETLPTNQFIVPRADFAAWAGESEHLLMENHYRRVRKKLGILIDKQGQPVGGAWNFDPENRQTYSAFARARIEIPPPAKLKHDAITRAVIALVKKEFSDHPGDADNFALPVTRDEALHALRVFVRQRLEHFGPYEDIMVAGEPVLFHSLLSPPLNIGLLTPRECVDAAVQAYEERRAPLASVEGFVRQIIGWREFINGIYWLRMPGYLKENALHAHRPLPGWITTGETEMNCLRETISQARAHGYNHHIQRLMVLGNFFLLGGYEPAAVYRWYLEMYVDAYDWVMAANVIGMILYADGGFMATKPYAAGSGYIHKMSNYCEGCRFKPGVKTGPDACPFNYLYWNFFAEHEERFAKNPRVGMMVQTWKKKSPEEQKEIRAQAKAFLEGPLS